MTAPTQVPRPGLVGRALADSRFRYLVVGGATAALELGLFLLLVTAGVPPAAANVISFCVAVVVTFAGHRWWSFPGNHGFRGHTQFVAYLALALFNVSVTTTIIHTLTGAGTAPWIAKLGCMVMVTTWNYLLLNFVIFRRDRRPSADHSAGPEGEQ